MQEPKLPRREREKIRHRSQILAAALNLFSEKGYHNVSMVEIARASEFAIGTLYKFFQNKEELFAAMLMEQADHCQGMIVGAMEEPGDEIDQLRGYVRTLGEMVRSHLPFIKLFLAENRGVGYNLNARLSEEMKNRHLYILSLLAEVIASGIRNNRFRKTADPYKLALAIDSTTSALLFLWLDAPDHHPFPDDPDAVLDIFFNGLLA